MGVVEVVTEVVGLDVVVGVVSGHTCCRLAQQRALTSGIELSHTVGPQKQVGPTPSKSLKLSFESHWPSHVENNEVVCVVVVVADEVNDVVVVSDVVSVVVEVSDDV